MPIDARRLARFAFIIALYALLIFGGQAAGDWAFDRLGMDLRPSTQALVHRMVMIAAALYVLLLALPFMPGVEIGLGLMATFGPSIGLLVYLCTVTALVLAFSVGRLVPPAALVALFRGLRLHRAEEMMAQLAPLTLEARLEFLLARVPFRALAFLLRHRYIALAVLVNLPGNAIIGGGGGIGLVAGLSRVFTFSGFLLTVALAVSPVPLAYYLTGGFR